MNDVHMVLSDENVIDIFENKKETATTRCLNQMQNVIHLLLQIHNEVTIRYWSSRFIMKFTSMRLLTESTEDGGYEDAEAAGEGLRGSS